MIITNINAYPELQDDYYDLKQKLNDVLKKDKEFYSKKDNEFYLNNLYKYKKIIDFHILDKKIIRRQNKNLEERLYQKMFQQHQHQQADEELSMKHSKFDQIYEWFKNQFSRIFGCRKLFDDDESEDDDESDPKKFLEHR